MGSSSSRRRKGAGKPKHLPKVGSPANQQWEHATHTSGASGSSSSSAKLIIIGAIGILVVFGLLVLTL